MPALPFGAVYCDLDATLLDPQQNVTPRTRRVLGRLRALGVAIGVATGRTMRSARVHIEAAGADAPAILFNGARVQTLDGKLLADAGLPANAAVALVHLCRNHGVFMNCYHGDAVRIEERCDTSRDSAQKDGVVQELVPDLLALVENEAPTKIMMITPAANMGAFEASVRARLEELGGQARAVLSEPTYLEALATIVSKGAALHQAASHIGLTTEKIVAFGDGLNDTELLREAGLGIAVENAHPDLRAIADRVCGRNDEDGVAIALEEIFKL